MHWTDYLMKLGARRSHCGRDYILDGFSAEFYLIFDTEEGGDKETVDILINRPGNVPRDNPICIVPNARECDVQMLLKGLGWKRFASKTQGYLWGHSIWTQEDGHGSPPAKGDSHEDT